jgi:hypothetical protein
MGHDRGIVTPLPRIDWATGILNHERRQLEREGTSLVVGTLHVLSLPVMTAREAARQFGMSSSTLSHWLEGASAADDGMSRFCGRSR